MKIHHDSGRKTLRKNLDKASFPFFLLKYPWHFLSKGKKSTLTPKMLDKNFEHISYSEKKSRLCITKLERIKLEPAANPSPVPCIRSYIGSRDMIWGLVHWSHLTQLHRTLPGRSSMLCQFLISFCLRHWGTNEPRDLYPNTNANARIALYKKMDDLTPIEKAIAFSISYAQYWQIFGRNCKDGSVVKSADDYIWFPAHVRQFTSAHNSSTKEWNDFF